MFEIKRQEIIWAGKPLVIESGRMANQSDGSVMISYGKTNILCTVVFSKKTNSNYDFFPLAVYYQEKTYAAGKIPGGFFKREGKPAEREVLISRLIDRSIRPLFPANFKNEVQVMCNLLSHDKESDPDIIAIIGASAALAISGVPLLNVIAAAKIARDAEQNFIVNPTIEEITNSSLELIVAGTTEGVLMVESEAKELPEEIMLKAIDLAHESLISVIELINKLASDINKEKFTVEDKSLVAKQVFSKIQEIAENDLLTAYKKMNKNMRHAAVDAVYDKVVEQLVTTEDTEIFTTNNISEQFKNLAKQVVRQDLLQNNIRMDGRRPDEVRPISSEIGFIPGVHGSALFTRGETQALVITTLGTASDEQIVDNIQGESRDKFMLHYNFPPYSVGEVGRIGPPGRREIGHGKLAWRAINPVFPSKEEFGYTVRVVSEIVACNGSSSMATVCGSSLSLMDAGVPIKQGVSGIAMGLIKEGDKFMVISDIISDEDHLGDMDFKVAGTQQGITSLQMDIKIANITQEIMQESLQQANAGRLYILNEMSKVIDKARVEVNNNAPRMYNMSIDKDKIRDIIGPGGKIIKQICEENNAKININDEGQVEIATDCIEAMNKTVAIIEGIVFEPKMGQIFHGTIEKKLPFGFVVNFIGHKTGLVHISEINGERIADINDLSTKENDKVWVQITGVDRTGKIKLSMKDIDQTNGQLK